MRIDYVLIFSHSYETQGGSSPIRFAILRKSEVPLECIDWLKSIKVKAGINRSANFTRMLPGTSSGPGPLGGFMSRTF